MGLREIGWDCMGWVHLAQGLDRWRFLVNYIRVINLRVPQNVIIFLISCTSSGFSSRAQLHGVNFYLGCLHPAACMRSR
jgi:hypothetical protein